MLIYTAVMDGPAKWSAPALEEAWFPLIAEGDAAAFHALYALASESVYAFALSILRSREDAEDVMQDTFLKIRSAAHLYRPMGKPMAWILRITRNLCLMRLRQRKHLADAPPEELCPAIDADEIGDLEDRLTLETAFRCLTEQELQIVMLHAVSGMKHQEIADLLEMPLSTVLSKYHRSLRRLRARLEEQLR